MHASQAWRSAQRPTSSTWLRQSPLGRRFYRTWQSQQKGFVCLKILFASGFQAWKWKCPQLLVTVIGQILFKVWPSTRDASNKVTCSFWLCVCIGCLSIYMYFFQATFCSLKLLVKYCYQIPLPNGWAAESIEQYSRWTAYNILKDQIEHFFFTSVIQFSRNNQ